MIIFLIYSKIVIIFEDSIEIIIIIIIIIKNPEINVFLVFTKILSSKTVQLFSTLIRRNVSWAANQHIRLISEESCDTDDWKNDAENSAWYHRNKCKFKIYYLENNYFKLQNYSIILLFYCTFDQINAALLCIRNNFFFKHTKILPSTTFK